MHSLEEAVVHSCVKNVILKIMQNSQESTCTGVLFKLDALRKKETPARVLNFMKFYRSLFSKTSSCIISHVLFLFSINSWWVIDVLKKALEGKEENGGK